jgi:hypothetical protein
MYYTCNHTIFRRTFETPFGGNNLVDACEVDSRFDRHAPVRQARNRSYKQPAEEYPIRTRGSSILVIYSEMTDGGGSRPRSSGIVKVSNPVSDKIVADRPANLTQRTPLSAVDLRVCGQNDYQLWNRTLIPR